MSESNKPGDGAFFVVRNVDIIKRLDNIEDENTELKFKLENLLTTFKVIGFFVAPALSSVIAIVVSNLLK